MPPEMIIGFGLSALVVSMLGKSPKPEPSKSKKTVITFVLPDCTDEDIALKEIKAARFDQ